MASALELPAPRRSPRRTPALLVVALLVSTLIALAAGRAVAWSSGHGHTGAADRTLRHGCHGYRYHYLVKPGTADWLLETYLFDPKGRHRGAGDFEGGSDPRDGHDRWDLCRSTTSPGRFTIRARLTWYTDPSMPGGQPTPHTVWLKPSHFHLTRP